jgi:hypothetical protein
MAWIKIDHVTPDKPEIVNIAESLGIDQDAVFGKCIRLWIWADQQIGSCNALSVTLSFVDRLTNCPNFGKLLQQFGWITIKNGQYQLSNFNRHNGQTAKARALTKNRNEKYRNARSVTPASLEIEKEIEIDQYNNTPEGNSVSPALDAVPASNGHHVDKYPKSFGIPSPIGSAPSKKRGRPKRDPFPDDSDPMELAKFFAKFYADWALGAKPADPPMLQKWAGTFDAMIRLDNRTLDQIGDMLNALDLQKPGKSGFLWRENILSPETLRKRWNEGKLHSFIPEAYHAR